MATKWQALILIVFILISVTLTKTDVLDFSSAIQNIEEKNVPVVGAESSDLSYQKASILSDSFVVKKNPSRKWDVLDPEIKSQAVLIQSLEDSFPFFNYNTYKKWPMASLTKLLTAVVILEDIGANKKISIDSKILETEGTAGNLKSGEVYAARDLLKIMLLTSSNDAAAAFESFVGKDEFIRKLNKKAESLGMHQTIVYDASGLSDLNESSATDILRLIRYILERQPEIFNWTRLENVLVQPINDIRNQTLYNINPLVKRDDFLGGKTGTSDEAGENLVAIFSFNNERLVMIILGSRDRVGEAENLLNWTKEAYIF